MKCYVPIQPHFTESFLDNLLNLIESQCIAVSNIFSQSLQGNTSILDVDRVVLFQDVVCRIKLKVDLRFLCGSTRRLALLHKSFDLVILQDAEHKQKHF